LQNAVKATFERVNGAFHISDFEFRKSNFETVFSVAAFLQKFGVIFSLNQDLLLEKTYMAGGHARQVVRPGLGKVSDQCWRPDGQHSWPAGSSIQPYIKLHGSTDWEARAGDSLLIMGNAKSGAITNIPLLRWYHDEFERCLRHGTTKLMIIGYSFQDEHINEVIYSASRDCGLRIFIIDPRGRAVLSDPKMAGALIPGPPRAIEEITIIGELRRTLKEMFSGDRFAMGEIRKYFET